MMHCCYNGMLIIVHTCLSHHVHETRIVRQNLTKCYCMYNCYSSRVLFLFCIPDSQNTNRCPRVYNKINIKKKYKHMTRHAYMYITVSE